MSRLNRKFNIKFSSHYLTFGTEKYTQLKKSDLHICPILSSMANKGTHEKANWPVLVLGWLLLHSLKQSHHVNCVLQKWNQTGGKCCSIYTRQWVTPSNTEGNKASTALQQLLGCVFNIPGEKGEQSLPCTAGTGKHSTWRAAQVRKSVSQLKCHLVYAGEGKEMLG